MDKPIPIGDLDDQIVNDLLDCHRANPACMWDQEQVGHEEKSHLVWFCHTHRIEGGRVRPWERSKDG